MGTIVYLEDIRLARSAPRVPAFSNFWIEISLAVLNGWLQASIRHLPALPGHSFRPTSDPGASRALISLSPDGKRPGAGRAS